MSFQKKNNSKGQGSKGINPTVYSWLVSIINGNDDLSGPTGRVSGSMGKFDLNKEQGDNKNLVRFENRDPAPRWHPMDKWVEFAKLWFEKAANERPRTTGKGQTGLEKAP